MAAKKAIGILRDFFKEQEKDERQRAHDDESAIEVVVNTPNPAIAEAKRHNVDITVAQGDTIFRIDAEDNKERIGTVAAKDVRLTKRRFSL